MDTNRDKMPASYAAAGVDEQREQDVFARAMRPWLARTAARREPFPFVEISFKSFILNAFFNTPSNAAAPSPPIYAYLARL